MPNITTPLFNTRQNTVGIGIATPTGSFKLETSGTIGPSNDNRFDLGAPDRRWRNVYASNVFGTASWASNASSALFASSSVSASYALTASYISGGLSVSTASYAGFAAFAATASYGYFSVFALTASYYGGTSYSALTASYASSSVTSSAVYHTDVVIDTIGAGVIDIGPDAARINIGQINATSSINLSGSISYSGSFVPARSQAFDFGSISRQIRTGYFQNITASWVHVTAEMLGTASYAIRSGPTLFASQSFWAVSSSYASSSLSSSYARLADLTFFASQSQWSVSSSFASSSMTASVLRSSGSGLIITSSYYTFGTKFLNIGSATYTTGLNVVLGVSQSAYVKATLSGWWPSTGSIGYSAEFFLQNDAATQNRPGMIVRQENNNGFGGVISAVIMDPGAAALATYTIGFQSDTGAGATAISNSILVYDVRGVFQSAS